LDLIIRAEVIGEIQRSIEDLPEGCKVVIKLAFTEGLKNEEIAKALGISINTVKSQKQRALKLLRLNLDFKSFLILLAILQQP
jgi:RNA polymerase sigma factor (sigma-70 family)